jgi:Chitobiase/beta-hexosaminidase C-terminal domain/Bacterial lectin/IPT/TIG domain
MLRLIGSPAGLFIAIVCCLIAAPTTVRAASTPIGFVQVASATPQIATATVNVSYPAAQTAGDMNVVVVGWNDTTATIQTVNDSAGNIYQLAIGPTSGTALRQSIYYAPNIIAGANTVTVTFSQAASFPDVRVLEYQGVTALDVTAGAIGNSASASSGAATTTSANELIFGANTVATTTQAAGDGFTSRIATAPDGDIALDKVVTVTGSNSATSTLSSAGAWVMQMATFSADAGPVSPPAPSPTVSRVSPRRGTTTGGTAVTITGTNFAAGAAVMFGGAAATSVAVVNNTTITAVTPAGSAGAVTVTVTNPGSQSGSLGSAFTYTASAVLPAPVFSVAAGTYVTPQTVAISDSTPGATIYYTTDGTTPTTSSTVYTAPITVSVTETIEAIAVETGFTNSAATSAAYTISPVLQTPVFSVAAGTYATAQTVALSDSTPGATIYYTTDGTTPTTSSTVYTAPITVSVTETIEAIAVETGFTNSAVASAAYTISAVLPTPTFSPAAGSYAAAQTVTISDATAGTTIYYTINGTTPTTSSAVYGGPLTVNSSETVKAIAVKTNFTNSAVGTAAYTITSGGTTYVNYPSGGFTPASLSLQGNAAVVGGALQLTDGGTGENRAAWFNTKVPVQNFVTDFTFQQLNASADGMTFTIQNSSIWTVGDAGGGLGYQDIPSSVGVKFDLYNNAGEGNDSTGLYTGGAAPTVPSVDLSSAGIDLHSGDLMQAHMVYDGTNLTMTLTDTVTSATVTEVFPVNIPNLVGGSTAYVGFTGGTGGSTATQNVLSWSYVSGTQSSAGAPAFSPAPGTYTTSQTVTISDTTAGASIYYTTDGTTPTTSSALYSGPIAVSASLTLEAIATATGFSDSPVAAAAYTISTVLPTPTFSPVAGSYTTAQTVTISDATAGTTIYYTTNGTTPTTSSTLYSGPITVSASQTLEAIAVKTGFTNSAVGTAAYTISTVLPTPTFSPAAGSYTTAQTVTISDATAGTTIYYTTNGTTPTTSSTLYSGPITVSASQTLEAIAVKTGFTNSGVATATYTINQQHEVDLTWDAPSSSSDPIEGYNVYRSPSGTSQFQLINSSIDVQTIYVDSTVQSGLTYDYIVKSVDYSGVESVPSNQVTVTIP